MYDSTSIYLLTSGIISARLRVQMLLCGTEQMVSTDGRINTPEVAGSPMCESPIGRAFFGGQALNRV
jgi:hypothetical protein